MSRADESPHAALTSAFLTAAQGLGAVDSRTLCEAHDQTPVVEHELVFSLLLWETTLDQAVKAMLKLNEAFVDMNELRVCMPGDIAAVLGARYAQCERRCEVLVESLRQISALHPGSGIHELSEMNKRDAKKELLSVEALPRFAAARTLLLALDAHAFPMDTKLARELHKNGFVDDHSDPDALAAQLEHDIPSSDTAAIYSAMERWMHGEIEIEAVKRKKGTPASGRVS